MYPGVRSETTGIFIKNQVDQLRLLGFIVDVLAISDPRKGRIPVFRKHLLWIFRFFILMLKSGRTYDFVHAHYVFPSGFLALIMKNLFKTKLIITAHGGDINNMANKGQFFFNQTRRILQRSDRIIAVGEELKKTIISKFNISSEKIEVLSMGVDQSIFKPIPKEKAIFNLKISQNTFQFLFVGNIIKAKGILELLQAYALIKAEYDNVALHIIGAHENNSFFLEVNSLIKEKKIDNIYLHDPMPQTLIANWMNASDVLILPSYTEGFGLVALEAMSVGTPVIGTKVGGLKYLLSNQAGLLVEPKSINSLKHAMIQILTKKNLRLLLIQNGKKVAAMNNITFLTKQTAELCYLNKKK